MAAGMARHEHGEVAVAFDEQGHILAATIDHVQNVGAYPVPSPLTSSIAFGVLFPGPYRVPEAGFSTASYYSNTVGRVAYRGPGSSNRYPGNCCSTPPPPGSWAWIRWNYGAGTC